MPEVTMANFEVESEHRSGELMVRLSGELDLASFDAVNAVLTSAQFERQPQRPDRSQGSGLHRFIRDQIDPDGP